MSVDDAVYTQIGPGLSNRSDEGAANDVSDKPSVSPTEEKLKLLWPTPQKLSVHPGTRAKLDYGKLECFV